MRSIPACAGEPSTWRSTSTGPGVYPRVCGGTSTVSATLAARNGLSPRVRGNPVGVHRRAHAPGSIPACAGEPLTWTAVTGATRVYPRVCGGTLAGRSEIATGAGLSPRVRGNPTWGWRVGGWPRSIPACAGEPYGPPASVGPDEVYPRVCGGTHGPDDESHDDGGLSPRVRGNPTATGRMMLGMRSIPACAGEPLSFRSRSSRSAVYPRVCGGTRRSPCAA